MNVWALNIPSLQLAFCRPATLVCQLFSVANAPMHFMVCWSHCSDRKKVNIPSYSAPNFSLLFLSLFKKDTDVASIADCLQTHWGQVMTKQERRFFFFLSFSLPLSLQTLIGLTGLFNCPQMHRGDSPTLNGFSHSCHFMPARENIGFGVGLTSYSGTSVKPLAHKEFGQDIGVNPQIFWKML